MRKLFAHLMAVLFVSCGFAFGQGLNDGLVAYYPFNGNAEDESGNNRHLSTQGQPTFEEGINGLLSAQFDDNADGFIISGQDTPSNTGAASISVWFDQDDPSGSQVPVGLTLASTSRFIIMLEDGVISYQHGMERGGRLEGGVFENQPTLSNGWNNFVLTTSGNGGKVSGYLNGQFLGDVSAGINLTGLTDYMVGAYTELAPTDQYRQAFRGRIQNLRIYNRALSNTEVSELYDLEQDPPLQLIINEQFDNAELEDFEITRQNISINNGFLKTSARGTLVSKEEILGPKRIKMRVRPDSSVETFSLFIATNGESGGFAELLGLQATWTTDYSALQWLDRAAAQPELARLNMGFPAGQWLDIEILDYLTSASVIINGESRLDVDLSNYERVGNKIGLHSRELGGGSTIDYFTVETLAPRTPLPPTVQLGALYESPSGEAIVIDATPAAGFPEEFTYQWCFNGFKIPANLGGTASSINIDSLEANEGTWSVTVTNETGSVEQSFEYRIYADTDSDGLSDAFEELISETDINKPDTDNDGLIDSEEVNTYRTNPNSSDSDSDGFTDLYELETAYDPNSAESTPDAQVNIMTAIEVDFNAALGATYEIQFSTDTIEWTVIEAGIVGEGNAVERLYSRKDFPTGFFRVERTDQ